MNSSKIERELGWKPKHDLVSGLRNTVEWYLRESEWIKSIKQQNNYQTWLQNNYQNRKLEGK